jgi:hypothetical protein
MYNHKPDGETDLNFLCCDLFMLVESYLECRVKDDLRFELIDYRGNICFKKL